MGRAWKLQSPHDNERRVQGARQGNRSDCSAKARDASWNQGAQLRGAHSTLVQSSVPAHDEKRGFAWIESGKEMTRFEFDVSREEWIDFLRILRRVLVELTRWIEKRYPETVA